MLHSCIFKEVREWQLLLHLGSTLESRERQKLAALRPSSHITANQILLLLTDRNRGSKGSLSRNQRVPKTCLWSNSSGHSISTTYGRRARCTGTVGYRYSLNSSETTKPECSGTVLWL